MTIFVKDNDTLDDKTYKDINEIKAYGDILQLYNEDKGLVGLIDSNTATITI